MLATDSAVRPAADLPGALAAATQRLSLQPRAPSQPVSNKLAAVLVPLYENCGIHVVLTLRSSKISSHPGEVCLPGGKAEPDDTDAAATALREAHEECALPPEAVHIVPVQQQAVLSKHMLSVTPVVGVISAAARQQLRAREAEVDVIFNAPLEMFLQDTKAHKHKDVWWNDTIQYRLHFFDWQQDGRSFNVWGLTAGILINVAQQIYDRKADFEVGAPGQPAYTDLYFDGRSVVARTS